MGGVPEEEGGGECHVGDYEVVEFGGEGKEGGFWGGERHWGGLRWER